MIANIVRLNEAALKISETSQEHTSCGGAMLVKLQAFIPQFNKFHPGCFPKKCPKFL